MEDQNLKCLERHYIDNNRSAYLYRQLTYNTKKVLLKNLYQRLYRQKRSFINALKIHLLLFVDQDYIKNLNTKVKDNDFELRVTRHPSAIWENTRLCLEIETEIFKEYQKTLKKVSDPEIRQTLLFHKNQIKHILEEMKVIEKYMI